eukprot:1348131-Rhodomonas_salina.1
MTRSSRQPLKFLATPSRPRCRRGPIVALCDVLSGVATAWSEVLMLVAKALIELEKDIYDAAEKRKGGWRGIKDFSIIKIREESENVRSLWFAPKDGSSGASSRSTSG